MITRNDEIIPIQRQIRGQPEVIRKHHRQITCILGGKVFAADGVVDDGCVLVRDGLIASVGKRSEIEVPSDAEIINTAGKRVIPGLIDLHLHGFKGQDVVGGDINLISEALAQHGVTAFVASLAAAPHEQLAATIAHLVANGGDLPGAQMVGIHLEGPYISSQFAGALNSQFFRLPDKTEMGELLSAGRGRVRIVTLAPELDGAQELIAWLSSRGVIPSVGHSGASFEQVSEAVEHGLRHATHTFNAMRQFHHREPGTVGAILSLDEITAEVIADGHHVHSAAVRLLLRLKGVEKVCLVSDAMPLAGMAPGVYTWLGQQVTIDSATARLRSGVLAGGICPLNLALAKLIDATDLPFEAALKTASATPARVLSLNSGAIEVGKDADIVVLDDAFQVHLAVVRGRAVYHRM